MKTNGLGIRMSSAGLIYLHYGKEVITNCILQIINDMESDSIIDHIKDLYNEMKKDIQRMETVINEVHDRVYIQFIRCIDAIDNGVDMVKLDKG